MGHQVKGVRQNYYDFKRILVVCALKSGGTVKGIGVGLWFLRHIVNLHITIELPKAICNSKIH